MPGSENTPDGTWRPRRILGFLGLGLVFYLALFAWSDRLARENGDRNPFYRIATAPAETDWLILGASHAMPLGFAGVPGMIRDATGADTLTLAVTGGGPFVQRLVAERFLADHATAHVLIVVDAFAFADPRWNAARMDDSDLLPKMPHDRATLATLARALPRGLSWRTLAAYASGFARINDPARFRPDTWDAAAKFDTSPRPSAAAEKARIAYLYPGPPDAAEVARRLADIAAIRDLAARHGADTVLLFPPLPARFRALLPGDDALRRGLADLVRPDTRIVDHADLLPESRYYFDSDHLNRAGIAAWLDGGLGAVLRGQ